MGLRQLALLLLLAAVWGGSFVFIRYSVPYLGAVLMVQLRVVIAGVALLTLAASMRRSVPWSRHWLSFLVAGATGAALPFLLIALALRDIDASTGAVLNSLTPLFATIVSSMWLKTRMRGSKLAGIALCIAGTAVLVGWAPGPGNPGHLPAVGCCILATALYGFTTVFVKVRLSGMDSLTTTAGTMLLAAIPLLPFIGVHPDHLGTVPASAWLAVAVLALISTAGAYVLFFRLIAEMGPVNASTVTLLIPLFGALWGVLFLGERMTSGRAAGAVIIIAGCALVLEVIEAPGFAARSQRS